MSSKNLLKSDLLPIALMALVGIGLVFTSSRPLLDDIKIMADWKSIFNQFQDIGTNCRVAIQPMNPQLKDAKEDELLQSGRNNAVAYQVPFRREPKYINISKTQWTYNSCDFQLPNVSESEDPGYLYLGPIWGDTKIYLNGEKIRSTRRPNYITLPVQRDWLNKPLKLEITSLNLGEGAGPMSLVPMSYLKSDLDLRLIERTLQYPHTERPLVPIGICGAMALLFSCVWLFGIRYRDVYWMIIATCMSAISSGLRQDPLHNAPDIYLKFSDAFQMFSWTAVCIAIYTFLRKPGSQRQLIYAFFTVAVLYVCQWQIPPNIEAMVIGRIGRHDDVVVGIALLFLSYLSYKSDKGLPPRRRLQRNILAAALVILGTFILWSGFFAFRVGINPSILTRTTFISIFGTFMMIDLVVFQRAYFEEKSLKEEEERRRTALEDRLELGQSIQRLLMPRVHDLDFGPFKIHAYFESAEKMAGDWFTWWPRESSFRVLCGDVVGKGPQAAIASTAILTSCHNLRKSSGTLENIVESLNTTIHELFGSTSSSTIACTELSPDGIAKLINHGFAGWIHLHDEKADLIPQRGPSLGAHEVMTCAPKSVNLAPGDRLIIFSDGVAEGPRSIKRICEVAKRNRGAKLANLAQELIATGAESVVTDDRTLIIIERV